MVAGDFFVIVTQIMYEPGHELEAVRISFVA
jgi:hypothetical protein